MVTAAVTPPGYRAVMRGSMKQRSPGSWRLVVDAGTDPVTGRRRQVTRTFRGPKREAENELNRLLTEVGAGEHAAVNATVAELVDRWMEGRRLKLSENTIDNYERIIRLHIAPYPIARAKLRKVRVSDLDDHYRARLEGGVGAEQVRKAHNILSGAFQLGVRWRWMPSNPARDAEPPRAEKAKARAPKPSVVNDLLAAAELGDSTFAAYVFLDAALGARRGEVCGLRWRNVDLAAGTVFIESNVILVKGKGAVVKATTKTDEDRTVAIGPAVVRTLTAHRARTAERLLACGVALDEDSFVFPALVDGSRPVRPDAMTKRFIKLRRTLVKAAGDQAYERVRLHDLRHHAATQLAADGVDARALMGRFGWRQLATAQRYIDFVAENDRDAAERIERILGRA